MANNLIQGIQQQVARCRELLTEYDHPLVAPTAGFAKAMIQAAITEGEAAIASGDVGRMVKAYQALVDCK